MAIEFQCECGARCTADESEVGRLFHCEACGLDTPVPSPKDAAKSLPADPGDLVDAQAHKAAADEMVHQVVAARGTEGTGVKHRADLDALRQETAADGDVTTAAEKRRADAEALRQQLGSRGGIAEMARELGVGRDEKAGGPGPATISAAELGPRTVRPVRKGPPKGAERAAHHIGIKRAIWIPSLAIGLVCMGLGAYCFFPSSDNPYARHLERFREELETAQIGEFDVVQVGETWWAVPKGAAHSASASGTVYYQGAGGFDELAVQADDYAKNQNYQSGRHSQYMGFGFGLLAVGAVLVVLSIVTYRDVRIVAALKTGGEQPPAAAAPELAEDVAEVEAEVVPDEPPAGEDAAPGEPLAAQAGPDDEGPPETPSAETPNSPKDA